MTMMTKQLRACCLLLGLIPVAVSLSNADNRHLIARRGDPVGASIMAFSSQARCGVNRCAFPISSSRINHHAILDSNKYRQCTILASTTISHDETVEQSPSAEPTNSTSSSSILPNTSNTLKPSNTGSTAIILNMNARSVTPQLISIASNIVGENNVFVTKTFEDAKLAARTVVRGCPSVVTANGEHIWNDSNDDDAMKRLQNYSLVIPVGGDGTLSGWFNTI